MLRTKLNALIDGASIYDATRFAGVTLSARTAEILANGGAAELSRLNLGLLQDAFVEIAQFGVDSISLFDSADLGNNLNGKLTRTTLTGLGMLFGFEYHAIAALNLFLSKGNDHFYVESTHTGTTNLNTGDEFAVLNVFNDVININSIAGITNITLGAGNDQARVNYFANGYQTFENGIHAPLFLAGGLGDDRYDVGLAGDGSALINIDGGTASEGLNDNLRIYGTDLADTFLFRPHVVASVTVDANRVALPGAPIERVNYTGTFGGNIRVYGRDGNDLFVFDDTSSPVEVFGDNGDDTFQVGQVFASPRDVTNPENGLGPLDYFPTTPTTRGFLSNGVSFPATLHGGAGRDSFTVYRNVAELFLFGEEDDDSFVVRVRAHRPERPERRAPTSTAARARTSSRSRSTAGARRGRRRLRHADRRGHGVR